MPSKQSSLGAFEPVPVSKPHVCPPLSQELRRRIQAVQKSYPASGFGDALRWVLAEADALAERKS